ncbi:MAG: putative N-acetylmannosamine-6-phosphate 2-epimerase [Armatimonadetes bacterium]|nr:putative N-acetylmannosamine-6-phosphate 2-epimerase [Armatimonadota bacterium]
MPQLTLARFLELVKECPLVASAQADDGTPLDHPDSIRRLAEASASQGVRVFRMEGVEDILELKKHHPEWPVMGLIKCKYPDSEVYISATAREVQELIDTGAEIIALDATERSRPNGETLRDLVNMIHNAGCLCMGDCDSIESIQYAKDCGADVISTTLSGYTSGSPQSPEPDLALVAEASKLGVPIIAEGRYLTPEQCNHALAFGACCVVIGGMLNDPIKNTRRIVSGLRNFDQTVGCVDLGGTWLRFATFHREHGIQSREQIPTPQTQTERMSWIAEMCRKHGVKRMGVSTGGNFDPKKNRIVEANEQLIPDLVGKNFDIPDIKVSALNDGLATAWGHAQHPAFATKRLVTLAIGSGVGVGIIDREQILTQNGEYPRLNDLPYQDTNVEAVLGGKHGIGSDEDKQQALEFCLDVVRLYAPDHIILCGGVSNASWIQKAIRGNICASPYGEDAGLIGAAWLALNPPRFG